MVHSIPSAESSFGHGSSIDHIVAEAFISVTAGVDRDFGETDGGQDDVEQQNGLDVIRTS